MKDEIKKDSPNPIYKQLKNIIIKDIKSRSLKPDTKIYSERTYSKNFGISRITVRQAINELVHEKQLIRIVGKGTFITSPDRSTEFTQLISFTDDMKKRGLNSKSKIIEFKLDEPDRKISEILQISSKEKVFNLKRIRFGDGKPMAIQESYIISKYCTGLLDYDFSKESLYRVLRNDFNLKLSYASNILKTRISKKEESDIFKLKNKISVFILEYISFLKNGRPIECGTSIYRGDKYTFYNIAVEAEN